MRNKNGFTIVELLIVIVVIGILAAITVVAFNGVRRSAIESSIQADLSNAAKVLANDFTTNNIYPTTLATANSGRGITSNTGTVFNYVPNNTASPRSYTLSGSAPGTSTTYAVDNNNSRPQAATGSAPTITLQPISWSGFSYTFTAAATGSPTPTVQWQRSLNNSTWANISGATTTSYATTGADIVACGASFFRAIFTNASGSATTNSGFLATGCGD